MKIDAHNHFWIYDPIRDKWIDSTMLVIQKDFMPADFHPILKANNFDACVAVQADQSTDETHFLLQLAAQNDWIKGVVGWINLLSPNIEVLLDVFIIHNKLKGFRHIAQAEADDFLISPAFVRGIEALSKTDFTYDLLIFPNQLEAAIKLVERFPTQSFVLDHIAKPYIKKGEINQWKEDIHRLAQFENVYCKVSGMITEADWYNWKKEETWPYIDVVVDAFGVKRLMYGSDWPVCKLAAPYEEMLSVVETYFESYSTSEKALIFGQNAARFYNL